MIRFVEDPTECRALWDTFTPRKRVWDEWDVLRALHHETGHQFRFLVHETDGRADGLVPLIHDAGKNRHELFGGSYPDSRELWIDLDHFPEIFEALPEPTVLFDLRGPWVDDLLAKHPAHEPNFLQRDDRYVLHPAEFGYDFENHIQNFSNEKRKGFRYDIRKVREKEPVLHWSNDDETDRFIELSVQRFGAESDYATPDGTAELKRIVSVLESSGWLRTLTISMDGVVEAVSMSAHYKDTLVALYAASNIERKNLGKLLNVETIQEACRLKVEEIDYMTGMAWKAAWDMTAEATRTMRKPAAEPPGPNLPAGM